MKFKTFKTFDRLEKLYEAADDENEDDGGDMPEEAQDEEPAEEGGAEEADMSMEGAPPAVAPEEDVNTEAGSFVSDNQKRVFAQTLLDALQADPPNQSDIPSDFLNDSNSNADAIIKFVQSYLQLIKSTSNNDSSELYNELKNV